MDVQIFHNVDMSPIFPHTDISSELLTRTFHTIDGVELEISREPEGQFFIRHQVYWAIAHDNRHVDPEHNCVIHNLKLMANTYLPSRKWMGHDFQFSNLFYTDGLRSYTIPIPLLMFEDFMRFQVDNYEGQPPDNERTRLGSWLKLNSLLTLVIEQEKHSNS